MQNHEKVAPVLRSDTRAVSIDADPAHVYEFIADPANLPTWAVGFCRVIRRDGDTDRWIVTTGHGELPIRYVTNSVAATIDFHFGDAATGENVAYSRVVPNGRGAEYIFTQIQPREMPDERFEAQIRALIEELQVLRALVHARSACRVSIGFHHEPRQPAHA